MIGPARLAAFDALSKVATDSLDLGTALAEARRGLRDERDRALTTEIATGVERWRATLDHLIVTAVNRPIERLDTAVVLVLRIGLYQLLYLERVPAAAVVSDAVNMTRRLRKSSAAGLVNAVLRRWSRARRELPLPARPTPEAPRADVISYLTVSLSHPAWLAARWLDRLGLDATEARMRFNNLPPPLSLRINTRAATVAEAAASLHAAGVVCHRGAYAPHALIIDEGTAHALPPSWGLVQDEASQVVALLAGDAPGRLVFDTCAAPGGKTTAMAASAPTTLVVAADRRTARMSLLRTTIATSGVTNVRLVQADLTSGAPFGPVFDCVFVDAPCSGLGTLRRDPDIKWRRHAADLAAMAHTQRQMLAQALLATRPGGRLVYATCSSEPEENEEVAAWFVESHHVRRLDARHAHPALPAALVDAQGYLRTSPEAHGLECFFGAVFERPSAG